MADQTLFDKTLTSDPTGKYFYAPSGSADFYITYADLFAAVNAAILALETEQNKNMKSVFDLNQSANFNRAFDADTKIFSIDVRWVSGTISLNIGTTLGGSELMPAIPITKSQTLSIPYTFEVSGAIYITMSGGTASFAFDYMENRFQ